MTLLSTRNQMKFRTLLLTVFCVATVSVIGQTASSAHAVYAQNMAAADPTVPAQDGPVAKAHVTKAGMNVLTGGSLVNAGIAVGTDLSQLAVTHNDSLVAIHVLDDDGLLDESSAIRFFANNGEHSPGVGNYWEERETYWIWTDTTSLQMLDRSVIPPMDSSDPSRTTAMQSSIWEDNQLYQSTMSGVDNDYWFHDLMNNGEPTVSIRLNNTLPLSDNELPAKMVLTGASRTVKTYNLDVKLGNSVESINWTNSDYYEPFSQEITSNTKSETVELTLRPSEGKSSIRIDKIYWEQPVDLNFDGSGARFSGLSGLWRYELSGVSADAMLYDVSNPMTPMHLEFDNEATPIQVYDGPEARDYILVASNNLHQPVVDPHQAIEFTTDYGADAIYIAPPNFHDELTALVAHRQTQGHKVAVVDVNDIYDIWSDGQVDPEAIRRFLQFAKQNWNPVPMAVTLAGDSTLDPRDYYGRKNGSQNANIIPAYLARVDPWIGHAVCQNCFAQLDGDDPLDSIEGTDALIDIMIGRLSVQNEEQLATVVDKILRYETAPNDAPGRDTSVYLAEEYINADGLFDSAGDFALAADAVIENWQSTNLVAERLYYDPRPEGVTDPWREPDAKLARQRSLDLMNAGPALVTYVGSANHYQLGSTDSTLPQPYMVGFNDLFNLSNRDNLFVMLQMTAYTSQFAFATDSPNSGTVFDERLLRASNGGAVATWG